MISSLSNVSPFIERKLEALFSAPIHGPRPASSNPTVHQHPLQGFYHSGEKEFPRPQRGTQPSTVEEKSDQWITNGPVQTAKPDLS